MRYLLVILLAVTVSACASGPGPGAACDTCAIAEADPVPGSSAAAAAAAGGQSVGQDPRATDTARIQPFTPISRGAGDQTTEVNQSEGRVIGSGAGVTQGLQVPTAAAASAGGGAIPQSVLQYRADIAALQSDAKALLEDARRARAMGQPEEAAALMDAYRAVVDRVVTMQNSLVAAEQGCGTRITNYYFQQGQRVVQSVVSGTSSGNPSSPPISNEGGNAAASALSTGAQSVMEAPPEPASTAGPNSVREAEGVAPPSGDSPPAGAGAAPFPPPAGEGE